MECSACANPKPRWGGSAKEEMDRESVRVLSNSRSVLIEYLGVYYYLSARVLAAYDSLTNTGKGLGKFFGECFSVQWYEMMIEFVLVDGESKKCGDLAVSGISKNEERPIMASEDGLEENSCVAAKVVSVVRLCFPEIA